MKSVISTAQDTQFTRETDACASGARRRLLMAAGAGMALPWLSACGDGHTPESERVAEAISWGRSTIQQVLQAGGASAATVGLLSDGEVVWQEAFGMADAQTGRAATVDTRFNIGSVSKVLAALASMILCDRGQLSLDRPIVNYLPAFTILSDAYRQITLRHLLSHSSGLPGTNGRNIFTFAPVSGYAQDTLDGLARFHIKHVPGELAVYCNDGFTLVEVLVAAVTGLPYAEFVRREILQPLDMTHSAYSLRPFEAGSFVRPVYEGTSYGQEFVQAYATGGLASTPADMLKLASMFLNLGVYQGQRIVSEDAVRQMGTDQTTGLRINPSPEWRWGLGWDNVRQFGMDKVGIKAWQKNGGTIFFMSEFFVLPDQKLALFLSLAGNHNPGPIAEGILFRALKGINAIRQLPTPVSTTPPAVVTVSGDASRWEGIYANFEAPFKVQVVDAQTLDLFRWEAGGWALLAQGLRPRADGWWWSDAAPQTQYRWETLDGKLYLLARLPGGSGVYWLTMPFGQRLSPLNVPLSPAWQARVGSRWEPVNQSPDSVISVLDTENVELGVLPDLPGYLFWNHTQLLRPQGNNRAGMTVQVPVNHGRDLVELDVHTVNGEEQLRVGSMIYRRLAS